MRRPNLDAIRRRAAAATAGTWLTGDRFMNGTLGSSVVVVSGKLAPIELDPYRNGRNDAAFIAHAHQDIPALLDEIDRRPAITPREAAALDRLLDAYVGNEEADPGMDDLRTLQAKIWLLAQDHTAYDQALGVADEILDRVEQIRTLPGSLLAAAHEIAAADAEARLT